MHINRDKDPRRHYPRIRTIARFGPETLIINSVFGLMIYRALSGRGHRLTRENWPLAKKSKENNDRIFKIERP